MKSKPFTLLIGLAIAALAVSSAEAAQNSRQRTAARPVVSSNQTVTAGTNWRYRHHYRPRSRFYFGVGLGYPYGYGSPYGYGYPYGYPYNYGYYGDPVYRSVPLANQGSLVIQVQQRLARAGYYRGTIDGVAGSGTRRAIRLYERAHGLPVDGQIDRQLLATMGLA